MIDNIPPVEQPKLKPMVEQVYVQKEWADIQTFSTEQEAKDYIKIHGGLFSKHWNGKFAVLFIPKESK